METISTEGSNSSEALKDFSATKIKLNGDVNGSMNVIDVDLDSRDSDFKKEIKDSLGGDASNDSSSKIKNGGEHSSDTDAENGDNSQDSSNSKLKNNNSNSHQDFHELMEVDDESVPSEGGNVGNCDSENNQSNSDKTKKVSDVEIVGESEEKIEDEERVKKDNAEVSNTENSKEVIEISSDQSDENNSKPGKDKESKEDKENGECKSENTKKSGKAKEGSAATEKNTNESSEAPKKIKEPQVVITPRRSSRTIQRPVRFGHEAPSNSSEDDVGNDSDEIEEITPQDPLADTIADIRKIPRKIGNTTIVVKDTKRLADIAARNTNTNKKEPTLVIIDTNSILSGRGAVPVAQSGSPQIQIPSVTVTPQPHIQSGGTGSLPQQSHHAKPYTGLPAATLPAQGIIPTKSVQRPPPILPMLTDDMYVVEAPSFIVPYVYEKPPVKKFKKYVKKMFKQIKIQEEEEEEAKKEENQKGKESKESKESDKETTGEAKKPDSDEKEKSEVIVLEENEKSSEEKKDENLLKEKNGEGEDKNKKSDENSVTPKKEEEKTVSCDNNNTDNSVILNEVKKKDDSIITLKEVSIVKKIKGKENKKDGKSSSSEDDDDEDEEEKKKPTTGGSYFDNPLGKFFMQIGMNLVQQFVQTDLLKQHKKKQKMGKGNDDTQMAINSLKKNLQMSKENNEPYTMEQNKCDYCSFKTESKLIMAHHLETPHMRNYVYRCNFCPLEVRGPHDILFHMEAEHNIRGRLERAPAFHQCPQCPFEDNQKGKLTRHLLTCAKKFRAEKNLEPPMDWEPPAKIPRMTRKPPNMPMNVNNTLYQQVRMGSEVEETFFFHFTNKCF